MKVEIPNQLLVKVSGMISRGIKEAEINEEGILIFTLTDGTKIELGSVKGDQGPRGESGVYVGTGEMPEGCNVQIDPSGEAFEFIQPPKTASIGQALLVKSIDETGKPTEWETGEVKGGSGGTSDHSKLSNRDAEDQHPIGAITGLEVALEGKQSAGSYLTEESDPTVPAWAKTEKKPSYTAQEVGADPSGTAAGLVAAHNTAEAAHNDIRLLISGMTDRLNALADSDDTTLDQLSEVVAYIKSNRTLIEAITINKVSVSDIVDNLTTNVSNMPLSAAQGVALKALIDAISIPTALPNPNALTFTGAVTGSYDGSEAKTINIPSGGGGGGSISLPLLYDLTTTEEVSWIDTGDNAYTVNSFLVVELVSIATTSNESDGDGSASMYPIQSGGLPSPWTNFVIENKISALLPKTYDKVFRAFCFRGEDGHWSSITAIRNDVNSSYTTPRMITVRRDGVSDQPMRGLIIGKSWEAKSNVLGVGSRLRVWGI